MTPSIAPRHIVPCGLFHARRAEHIMGMPVADTNWTVDMLDALPDDGQRYEIIDGELFVTPAPSDIHQFVVGELHRLVSTYLHRSSVARALVSPADVRRDDRRRNRVQPDVFVIRLTDGRRPTYPYDLRDLLLAVEVTSSGNPLYDYQTKRALYLEGGVPEYWIVNADARLISRWRALDDPGEEFSRAITWHPSAMPRPLEIDIQTMFADALS